jgi:hypothetical protein
LLAPHPGFGSGELAGKRSRRRFATDVGGAGLGGSAARCTRWDAVTLLPCSTSRGRWSGSCAQRCSVFSARGPGTGALAVAGWAVCSRRPNAPGR